VNFAAFVAWKAEVKRERPEVIDLSETRIAAAFAHLRRRPSASTATAPVHRCDLARTWCRVRGFPDALVGRTLVSEGVRHALMTKGWLYEKVFGAAIVPEDDLGLYRDAFRAQPPRQEQLAFASDLLGAHADFPRELACALHGARATLLERLARAGLAAEPLENGYLATVERSAEEVLGRLGLLTIPVSVFGSRESGRCLASALPAR
jgi:hypothetical protein